MWWCNLGPKRFKRFILNCKLSFSIAILKKTENYTFLLKAHSCELWFGKETDFNTKFMYSNYLFIFNHKSVGHLSVNHESMFSHLWIAGLPDFHMLMNLTGVHLCAWLLALSCLVCVSIHHLRLFVWSVSDVSCKAFTLCLLMIRYTAAVWSVENT